MTSRESNIKTGEWEKNVYEAFRWLTLISSLTWVWDTQKKHTSGSFAHWLSVAHSNSATLAGKRCDTDQQWHNRAVIGCDLLQSHQFVFSGLNLCTFVLVSPINAKLTVTYSLLTGHNVDPPIALIWLTLAKLLACLQSDHHDCSFLALLDCCSDCLARFPDYHFHHH